MASVSKTPTKKLVNSPETCVDDNLKGLVAIYPSLHLHPSYRLVTLRPKTESSNVAIIGGGGSGHEPFASGMVGTGMLHGGVAGGVFASPPTAHILYSILQLSQTYSGGVVVIIGNYTGDRLNFGKAIEKAKLAGVTVNGIIVGEDVASSGNKTGGRGMCGEVFLYKICGAMSYEGRTFDTICKVAEEVTKNIATLGVCLTACSLPGQALLFHIRSDEMELGAGVHGEAGIKKMKIATAAEVVEIVLEQIVEHLKLTPGDRVAVMLNNLGGTSIMEMNILSGEAYNYLQNKHFIVERMYTGHMKSSLEMHGFQICLLHLNVQYGDYWVQLLDTKTDAPAWPGTELSLRDSITNIADDEGIARSIYTRQKSDNGPKLMPTQQVLLRSCLQRIALILIKNEQLLNRLDSGCGDGDCGNTMKNLALAILKYVETSPLEYMSTVLWDLAEISERDMGGTSGGLYSLGLAAASKRFGDADTVSVSTWAEAWEEAFMAISKYGGAEEGDRTMLDVLGPSLKALNKNIKSNWNKTLEQIRIAAEKGAEATARMTAKAGRASYVDKDHVLKEDAGARAVALWLNEVIEELEK